MCIPAAKNVVSPIRIEIQNDLFWSNLIRSQINIGSHIKWLKEKWPPNRPICGESMEIPTEAMAANHHETFNSRKMRHRKSAARTMDRSINKLRIATISDLKSSP